VVIGLPAVFLLGNSQRSCRGNPASMPQMYSKAYRWIAEMEEIPEFVGLATPQSDTHSRPT
jgi:hypothetical protein